MQYSGIRSATTYKLCNEISTMYVGSGTGIASLVLAALLSHEKAMNSASSQTKILATDLRKLFF